MNKITLLLVLTTLLIYGCKPQTSSSSPSTFTFTVEEDTSDLQGLPALQSFALGVCDSGFVIFGGRANGFHGFGSEQNFPYLTANKTLYPYNKYTHTLYTMSVDSLPEDLHEQYISTNMENRQIGEYLYVCGGYGMINAGQQDSNWVTHNIISRVNVNQMYNAIRNSNKDALAKGIAYDKNDIVISTGGELFKLNDGKFYLVLGHDFRGPYGGTHYQQYLDSVHVFTLTETDSTIQVNSSFQYISDHLVDSITEFRRRDLVVAPNVLSGGTSYGISIYAGVFTTAGNTFHYPIYITGGNTPSYYLDTSYYQLSNVYSAPNLQMYDSVNDLMYTTIFGGLGDTMFINGDSAAFTKVITTLKRNNAQNTTSPIYNSSSMPDYVAAEGIFIPANGAPVYNSNNLGIIDYNKIPTGNKQLLGYIYGGIYSDSTQWSNVDTTINSQHYKKNITSASNRVFKVWITKD